MSTQIRRFAGLTHHADGHLFAGGVFKRVKRRAFVVDAVDRVLLGQAPVAVAIADVSDVLMSAAGDGQIDAVDLI